MLVVGGQGGGQEGGQGGGPGGGPGGGGGIGNFSLLVDDVGFEGCGTFELED